MALHLLPKTHLTFDLHDWETVCAPLSQVSSPLFSELLNNTNLFPAQERGRASASPLLIRFRMSVVEQEGSIGVYPVGPRWDQISFSGAGLTDPTVFAGKAW